jgi:undecaprenyl-diphosphatase
MIEFLIKMDQEIFLALNGFHAPWLDPIMFFISKTWVWVPLYAVLVWFIFKDHGRDGWLILLGITLTIVLADQITTTFMKPFFSRLRPSHEPLLESLVHIVNGYKGSQFGFASSHAANTFGAATFMFLLFGKTHRWVAFLFAWAALVTYSRIYLGVHYPGDIVAGALVGMLSALAGFKFYRWLKRLSDRKKMSA